MKRYEYKTLMFADVDLISLGQDGWELCGIAGSRYQSESSWIFKRDISSQDVHIGLLTSCSYVRGVGNLQHRTIAEFAQFVENVMSNNSEYQKYRFDWNRSDAIEVWIEKFHKYCKEIYDDILKDMIKDEDDK